MVQVFESDLASYSSLKIPVELDAATARPQNHEARQLRESFYSVFTDRINLASESCDSLSKPISRMGIDEGFLRIEQWRSGIFAPVPMTAPGFGPRPHRCALYSVANSTRTAGTSFARASRSVELCHLDQRTHCQAKSSGLATVQFCTDLFGCWR